MKVVNHLGGLYVLFDFDEYRSKLEYQIEEAKEQLELTKYEAKQIKHQKGQEALSNLLLTLEYDLEHPVPNNQSWITRSKLRYARFNNLIKVMRKAGIDILIFRDRKKDGISVKVCNRDGITDRIRAVFGMLADQVLPLGYEKDQEKTYDPYHGYYNGTERYLFHIKPKPGAKYEEAWKALVSRKSAERKAQKLKSKRTAASGHSEHDARKSDRNAKVESVQKVRKTKVRKR